MANINLCFNTEPKLSAESSEPRHLCLVFISLEWFTQSWILNVSIQWGSRVVTKPQVSIQFEETYRNYIRDIRWSYNSSQPVIGIICCSPKLQQLQRWHSFLTHRLITILHEAWRSRDHYPPSCYQWLCHSSPAQCLFKEVTCMYE